MHFIGLRINWNILFQAVTLFLAAAGHYLTTEAQRTVQICYNIINDANKNEFYERDIIFLAQQVVHSNIELSASGFFSINFTMMGFIVSSITSYIIVALEFMNDGSSGQAGANNTSY